MGGTIDECLREWLESLQRLHIAANLLVWALLAMELALVYFWLDFNVPDSRCILDFAGWNT